MSIMVGVGRGAREGVLIKDAQVLETLEKADTIIVDKTGTLTEGRPRVTEVIPAEGTSETELLALASAVEQSSEHPLARAIVESAKDRELEVASADDFSSTTGGGVEATVRDQRVLVGKRGFLVGQDIELSANLDERSQSLQAEGRTVVYVLSLIHI